MAHYKFIRDLKDGQRGESIAYQALLSHDRFKKSHSHPPSQEYGDFQLIDGETPINVEVKYDILAENTGNMCFEFSNGKGKLTGIMATKADVVAYVLNNKGGFVVYLFLKDVLKDYLIDSSNSSMVRIVNGGDKKNFTMALSPVSNIAKLSFLIIEVDRASLLI